MIAVHTNLLVYAHREDSEWHEAAYRAIASLAEGAARGDPLAVSPRVSGDCRSPANLPAPDGARQRRSSGWRSGWSRLHCTFWASLLATGRN